MRVSRSRAAVIGGAACLLAAWATPAHAQIVNANWGLPNSTSTPANNDTGTSPTAQTDGGNIVGASTGWYMAPAANPNFGYTNPGQRDQFYSVEPIVNPGPPATGWSFWLQTFTQSGLASQSIPATAGVNYTFGSQLSFQVGSGPGNGYNAVTLANQTEASPIAPNSGDLFSYLQLKYENASGGLLGTHTTTIPAGSVTTYNVASGTGAGSSPFLPYSVVGGVAPAGTTQAVLTIGWNNGGLDGGTGGQSAFADDETFGVTAAVPEPASLGLLSLGGAALMARRRRATK